MPEDQLSSTEFTAHIELLNSFLHERRYVVDRIQNLLNAQRQPAEFLQDRSLLTQLFEECFFAQLPQAAADVRLMRGRLEDVHRASGFRPRQMAGLFNDLIHPAELVLRAFYFWHATRWPGRNGRLRYAHALFNAYILRNLEFLSVRLWDDNGDGNFGGTGCGNGSGRLATLQQLLDNLWRDAPADQPVLVRDARWLIPLAQSPTTDELSAYFEAIACVAGQLEPDDTVETLRAQVCMIGGHLRSQIRHYCLKDNISLDHRSIELRTRASNALDFALLIQGLVPLLQAYEQAVDKVHGERRVQLAGAILQAISPDPEVFLNELDLLGAYSMLEQLFLEAGPPGQVQLSPLGHRHVALIAAYADTLSRVIEPLRADCPGFRPPAQGYSPLGAIYGTPSNLTEFMVMKTLQPDADIRFSIEDAFINGTEATGRRAWADGWRKLPHIAAEIQRLYDYPQQFSEALFERFARAFNRGVAGAGNTADVTRGRLVPVIAGEKGANADADLPELPARFVVSSDNSWVASERATYCEESDLLRDRQEGHFLVSFQTDNGWIAIHKDVLTEVIGAGESFRVSNVPADVPSRLRLMLGSGKSR